MGESPEESADLEAIFRHAEGLVEREAYEEAMPLFLQVLSALNGRDDQGHHSLEAEVLAYLGVAAQSLGRVQLAVDAYTGAVERDPLLHVCQANLASLLLYQEKHARARVHLERALRLDPPNPAYAELWEQLEIAT